MSLRCFFPFTLLQTPQNSSENLKYLFCFQSQGVKEHIGYLNVSICCLFAWAIWHIISYLAACGNEKGLRCTQYLETVPNLLYASDNRHWLWKTDCNWWRFQYMEIYCWNHSSIAGIDGYYWILLIIVSESIFLDLQVMEPHVETRMEIRHWSCFSLTSKAMFQP